MEATSGKNCDNVWIVGAYMRIYMVIKNAMKP